MASVTEGSSASARHGGQQLALGGCQGAHGLVGVQQGAGTRRVVGARGQVDAPVVQAHGQVEQPGVHTGKVEVEEARELFALEHHVVAEQVGVHRAAWQRGVAAAGGHMVLVGQLGAQQCRCFRVDVRQHHGHGFVPPG